jgi:hypothetical protein
MGVHFGPEGDRMARTVIQIAADPSYLYALCNDGEIFRLVNHVAAGATDPSRRSARHPVEAETWIYSDRGRAQRLTLRRPPDSPYASGAAGG